MADSRSSTPRSSALGGGAAVVALAILCASPGAQASCNVAAAGDINGDFIADIADVQCVMLVVFAAQGTFGDEVLGCVAEDIDYADANCDFETDITDLLIYVEWAFGNPLGPLVDADGNGYPDTCQDTDVFPELCNGIDDDCDLDVDEDPPSAPDMCGGTANGQASCATGSCVAVCSALFYDLNGAFADGCECGADAYEPGGGSAAAFIDLTPGAPLSDNGQTVVATANLVPLGDHDWYRIATADGPDANACDTYHFQVSFDANPDGARFDVYRGGTTEAHKICQASSFADWSTDFANGTTSGECPCAASPGVPGQNVCSDDSSVYYVRVYRPSGAVTCNAYTLRVRNGVK